MGDFKNLKEEQFTVRYIINWEFKEMKYDSDTVSAWQIWDNPNEG